MGRLEPQPVHERLRLVDTFDRRLDRANSTLRVWGRGKQRSWQLVGPDGGVRGLRSAAPISFPNRLPACPLRSVLASICDPRRLLVLADVVVSGTRYEVVAPSGATLLTAAVETFERRDGTTAGPYLLLHSVLGHAARFDEAAAAFQAKLGASAAGGRRAILVPSPPSPPALELTAEMPLARALGQTLEPYRAAFLANLEGARRNLDPEFLHDLRVAARRSRALLGESRRELADPRVEALRTDLRAIGAATNAARDLDVLLLALDRESAAAPSEDHAGLEVIRRCLEKDRAGAARRVERKLSRRATAPLIERWRGLLEESAAGADPRGEGPPIEEFAARRLRRRARKLVDDARQADPASRPTDLHELRLLGKKVRYLLEAWGSLVLDDPEPVVRQLKGVQDRLGELNDLAVQRQRLLALAPRLSETTKGAKSDLRPILALGGWLERLRQHEHAQREELIAHRELWLPAIEDVARACRAGRPGRT